MCLGDLVDPQPFSRAAKILKTGIPEAVPVKRPGSINVIAAILIMIMIQAGKHLSAKIHQRIGKRTDSRPLPIFQSTVPNASITIVKRCSRSNYSHDLYLRVFIRSIVQLLPT